MGVVFRIVFFLVGLVALLLTGLVGAAHFGVETEPLLANLGPASSVATAGLNCWSGLLGNLGGVIGNAMNADPENPGAVVQYAPLGIAALVSVLLIMFSTRR